MDRLKPEVIQVISVNSASETLIAIMKALSRIKTKTYLKPT
jgi:hypothetical protein